MVDTCFVLKNVISARIVSSDLSSAFWICNTYFI